MGLAGTTEGGHIKRELLLVVLAILVLSNYLHSAEHWARIDKTIGKRFAMLPMKLLMTRNLIFSIGYAGEHFRYYASGTTIQTPQTVDELSSLMQGKKEVWCLITAWLPDIRPPYEDGDSLYRTTRTN